jgi:hypothetical protein
MKEFKSLEDVEKARLPDEVSRVVRGTLEGLIEAYAECGGQYEPDVDGWTVLLEKGDAAERELVDQPLKGRRGLQEQSDLLPRQCPALGHLRPLISYTIQLRNWTRKAANMRGSRFRMFR